MESKHTPGNWEVNTEAGRPNSEVFCGDVLICDCRGTNVEMPPEEVEANARLIAAAPIGEELADAVLGAVPRYSFVLDDKQNFGGPPSNEQWAAIVAKAREFKAKTEER